MPRSTPPSAASNTLNLGGCHIEAAELVIPCPELDATVIFFTEQLGFRVDAVVPADSPRQVVISGYGVRIRLDRDAGGDPGALRLTTNGDPDVTVAPNGTRIELVAANRRARRPSLKSSLVIQRLANDAQWTEGRAGMRYRDLIPDRQGGRFIASHISIAGGDVEDYVHYHDVHFQMIYCYQGWVRVVYEDQGEPFVLRAGDCVVQPPLIRHRVLEASPGLEVIEIGSPATHETLTDHQLVLPTATFDPQRNFDGQRFVRHQASEASWQPWGSGYQARDLGIAEATSGIAGGYVVRSTASAIAHPLRHDAELVFTFITAGSVALQISDRDTQSLSAGDCFVVPAAVDHTIAEPSLDLELLIVSLPAAHGI